MEIPSTPNRSAELLLVSPLVSSSNRRSRKRHITPSYEAASPKKVAVIFREAISGFAERIPRPIELPPGWPTTAQEARIDARQTLLPNPMFMAPVPSTGPHMPPHHFRNPLSVAPQPTLQQLVQNARHITLPFNLRDDPSACSKDGNMDILMNIFPGTNGISQDGSFLTMIVSEMPSKPWPKTIAGLPLYLTTHHTRQNSALPIGIPAHRRNGTVADHMNGRDMENWDPLFDIVRDHFLAVGVSITQVVYWGCYLFIVLEHRNADTTKLPWKIAQLPCQYVYNDQMGTPVLPQARPQTDPTPGNPDQTQYQILQPGLRVTSGYLPDKPGMFQATTTGILVKDRIGNEFMTVAAHGFPSECGNGVNHAVPSGGRKIGEVIYELSHTDIALVKLEPQEKFINMTFESQYMSEPIQLTEFISSHNVPRGQLVVLDSPDTGCIDGTYHARAFERIPTDDPNEPRQEWIRTAWIYSGQCSAQELPAGMCGSAIWTEDGKVMGFFRYAAIDGLMADWCISTAVNELIKKGFTVVDTSGREQ